MRVRIRDHSEVNYQVPRRNVNQVDHIARTNVTAGMIAWYKPSSVLDLACGDGSLTTTADSLHHIDRAQFVDISRPSIDDLCIRYADRMHPAGARSGWNAAVSDALSWLEEDDEVFDLVVLSEMLEHFPDPDDIVRRCANRAKILVASSPLIREAHGDDGNPEHLWAFDEDGYKSMLEGNGWLTETLTTLAFRDYIYTFQIWTARCAS